MTESELQRRCLRHLEGLGWYGRKVVVANRAGTPDLLACLRGRFAGFEFKSEKGRQSELQKWNEEEIRRSGGMYYLIRSFGEFKEALEEIVGTVEKRSEE